VPALGAVQKPGEASGEYREIVFVAQFSVESAQPARPGMKRLFMTKATIEKTASNLS
jgi:hypothetical protein